MEILKRIISKRSYIENWKDSKEKDKDDDPMDFDYHSKRKRTLKLNKIPSSSITIRKISMDIRKVIIVIDIYMTWTIIP